ncbi:MAG TPA: N-acetylmuramoyl-L-alanine amidase [Vicinamibacterales bacterium]|nr:N-acetylmuramoyl-L-alanine amidase [Vicinamibacterales bacterium]
MERTQPPAPAATRAALMAAAAALALAVTVPAQAQTARARYEQAQRTEQGARAVTPPAADQMRRAARTYEAIVRRYPTSGYSDNALWQAAGLMLTVYERTSAQADRDLAEHYLDWLANEYPHSSLGRQVPGRRAVLTAGGAPAIPQASPPVAPPPPPASHGARAELRRITRTALPRGDRITIELTREVAYAGERLDGPDRVFFDFAGTDAGERATQDVNGRLLHSIRLGRHEGGITRVVLELTGRPRYSAFPLYDPFRLVIDLESDALPPEPETRTVPTAEPVQEAAPPAPEPAASGPPRPTPAAPAATATGGYTLARQLGLGVSRIVIDAGHGGHDPGAKANGLVEAELVLDIARRVETILGKQPGFEVLLTRSGNVFIPLEERTAIANREGADLFVSIHANASRRTITRGVETYVLNVATNPEAEAVAARENASSAQTMGTLPTILNAIALTLNNKLDESRELATFVQTGLVRGLRAADSGVKDLGVKQAPFVVLIGAQMPSILVEISFITNKAEATSLKQNAYRDRIAQALADAIVKYKGSLKKITTDDAPVPESRR